MSPAKAQRHDDPMAAPSAGAPQGALHRLELCVLLVLLSADGRRRVHAVGGFAVVLERVALGTGGCLVHHYYVGPVAAVDLRIGAVGRVAIA